MLEGKFSQLISGMREREQQIIAQCKVQAGILTHGPVEYYTNAAGAYALYRAAAEYFPISLLDKCFALVPCFWPIL